MNPAKADVMEGIVSNLRQHYKDVISELDGEFEKHRSFFVRSFEDRGLKILANAEENASNNQKAAIKARLKYNTADIASLREAKDKENVNLNLNDEHKTGVKRKSDEKVSELKRSSTGSDKKPCVEDTVQAPTKSLEELQQELASKTVKILKSELKDLNLPTNGLKKDLVLRLATELVRIEGENAQDDDGDIIAPGKSSCGDENDVPHEESFHDAEESVDEDELRTSDPARRSASKSDASESARHSRSRQGSSSSAMPEDNVETSQRMSNDAEFMDAETTESCVEHDDTVFAQSEDAIVEASENKVTVAGTDKTEVETAKPRISDELAEKVGHMNIQQQEEEAAAAAALEAEEVQRALLLQKQAEEEEEEAKAAVARALELAAESRRKAEALKMEEELRRNEEALRLQAEMAAKAQQEKERLENEMRELERLREEKELQLKMEMERQAQEAKAAMEQQQQRAQSHESVSSAHSSQSQQSKVYEQSPKRDTVDEIKLDPKDKKQALRKEMEERIRRMSSNASNDSSSHDELILQEANLLREQARKRAMDKLQQSEISPDPPTSVKKADRPPTAVYNKDDASKKAQQSNIIRGPSTAAPKEKSTPSVPRPKPVIPSIAQAERSKTEQERKRLEREERQNWFKQQRELARNQEISQTTNAEATTKPSAVVPPVPQPTTTTTTIASVPSNASTKSGSSSSMASSSSSQSNPAPITAKKPVVAATSKPVSAWRAEDNYEISDKEASDDSESESDDDRPKKPIPDWARKDNLTAALRHQFAPETMLDPDAIFGDIPHCDLEAIFKKGKKKTYRPRGSSAQWEKDGLKEIEKKMYRKDLGLE